MSAKRKKDKQLDLFLPRDENPETGEIIDRDAIYLKDMDVSDQIPIELREKYLNKKK
jgi:hypothetical protein